MGAQGLTEERAVNHCYGIVSFIARKGESLS